MDSSPSTCKDGGQAANYDIGRATGPENDVSPRQDLCSRQKIGDAVPISDEGGALQMAKKRTEEQQDQHDGSAEVSFLGLPSDIYK